MFAGFGVQTLVWQAETFDGLIAHDMRLDNLVDVGIRDVSVPDSFRIDDDRWAMLALIEAASLIGAHATLQSTLG